MLATQTAGRLRKIQRRMSFNAVRQQDLEVGRFFPEREG